jgi:hypothetical protein
MVRLWFIANCDESRDASIRTAWARLLDRYSSRTLFYQSPAYFDHLASHVREGDLRLAIVEGDDGAVLGVVPLRRTKSTLEFRAGAMRFGAVKFDAVRILGGMPLLPPTSQFFDLLFEGIARAFPACPAIELRGLPISSPLWNYVKDRHPVVSEYALYVPDGPRDYHTTDIPESFEAYLGGFKRKKRYNLKRQIRRLEQWSGGALALQRVQSGRDVAEFRKAYVEIETSRWRQRPDNVMSLAEMIDLAERGLLLGYILQARGQPCALAFGTRFADTLLVHSFAHDRAIERLSPGMVLQMLMMQDLIQHRLARRVDYGFGEPKYRLTNFVDRRADVTLLQKNVWSRSTMSAHASFVRLTDCARRLTRWHEHGEPQVQPDDDARFARPAPG